MATLSPIAEYLLAYTTPTGQKLARFGAQGYSIRLLPPNQPVSFIVGPLWGYANIFFWHQFSENIVPNTVFYEVTHRGVVIQAYFISSLQSPSTSGWVEVTARDPLLTRLTNFSTVNQLVEGVDSFLVISSPTELAEVQKLVQKYGGAS